MAFILTFISIQGKVISDLEYKAKKSQIWKMTTNLALLSFQFLVRGYLRFKHIDLNADITQNARFGKCGSQFGLHSNM